MNVFQIALIPLFALIFICCYSGNGSKTERLRADSLVREVVKGNLSLLSLAESNEFMYFKDKYFYEPANLKIISKFDKIQIQVVTYRIYQHVKLENNRYRFHIQNARQLHIPNKAFVYYQRSFEEMNRRAAASKDSIRLKLPNDYATLLIAE